jgi:hypothetical protein
VDRFGLARSFRLPKQLVVSCLLVGLLKLGAVVR